MTSKMSHQTRHPIEAAIISHVERYRLTTAEAAWRDEVRGMTSLQVSTDRLEALARRGDLSRTTLDGHTTAYVLDSKRDPTSPRASRRRVGGTLSTRQKMTLYGCLAFCCLQDTPRVKLTSTEISTRCPGLGLQPSSARSYYVAKEAGQARLGFVRVDTGGRGRWDRIVARFTSDLHTHWQNEAVQKLLKDDSFEASLVTALPAKADRIATSMRSHLDDIQIPVHCVAVPRLVDLMAPQPD